MSQFHSDCYDTMKTIMNIFPIEVDLFESAQAKTSNSSGGGGGNDDDEAAGVGSTSDAENDDESSELEDSLIDIKDE